MLTKQSSHQHPHTYHGEHRSDSSAAKIIDKIFADALLQHASDVHFEPYEHCYRVRLRIDGILYCLTEVDHHHAQALCSRLKVMAQLDIAERRLPQDGRCVLQTAPTEHFSSETESAKNSRDKEGYKSSTHSYQAKVDCRISTCPTLYGEKIVVRFLNPTNMNLDLGSLGLLPEQRKIFDKHIQSPQGMLLVTGPTGSGKSVTLYTALNTLNTSSKNISTAEDPVEMNFFGINQVEINNKIGFGFAKALRAFLRQDPDIIMIGEIRDTETAEIAVKAAQTGHLVLSTLHTNSAAESITRLLNMSIASFNIASTVNLLIAQRLVRKLCQHCKHAVQLPFSTLRDSGLSELEVQQLIQLCRDNVTNMQIESWTPPNCEPISVFQAIGIGCEKCKGGYRGRCGVFELLPMSLKVNELILKHASINSIEQQAKNDGMISLRTAAWYQVLQGETTLEEINRVIL